MAEDLQSRHRQRRRRFDLGRVDAVDTCADDFRGIGAQVQRDGQHGGLGGVQPQSQGG